MWILDELSFQEPINFTIKYYNRTGGIGYANCLHAKVSGVKKWFTISCPWKTLLYAELDQVLTESEDI